MADVRGVSVVLATYNMPEWLAKVLAGYAVQSYRNFELIVADDGSTVETRRTIETFQDRLQVPVRHLWHEDCGYRRQTILNRAILAAAHDYLLFSDGDCVPRQDFVETHARLAESGRFLSGGYCKLSMRLSQAISASEIETQDCFRPEFLDQIHRLGRSQRSKLAASPMRGRLLDWLTPTRATFNNCNSSAWKADLLAVNGYDERMQYGGPDRELGERLVNAGIKGKQIRHRAICLHLEHARSYKTQDSLDRNRAIRRHTRRYRVVQTAYGIAQAAAAARQAQGAGREPGDRPLLSP